MMTIAGYLAVLSHVPVGADRVALWRVADLERHIDRAALLGAAQFDLILAAELLYDRRAFDDLARAVGRSLAPGGRALFADAGRIDTRAFYDALSVNGLTWRATGHAVREVNLPLTVHLVEITHLQR